MNDKIKSVLVDRQKALMYEWHNWEEMQTAYSYDVDFYRFCQWKMDALDEEAEQIRHVLETEDCQ